MRCKTADGRRDFSHLTSNVSPLVERLYSLKTGRKYKKVNNGRELFGRLDPYVAYGKCPRFIADIEAHRSGFGGSRAEL